MLLLLEDNAERVERFAAVLRDVEPALPLRVWRDAHAMIREAGSLLPSATLLSLDHDLETEPGAPDPGDGYLVAQFLVSQLVVRPVIVHSRGMPAGAVVSDIHPLSIGSEGVVKNFGGNLVLRPGCPRTKAAKRNDQSDEN